MYFFRSVTGVLGVARSVCSIAVCLPTGRLRGGQGLPSCRQGVPHLCLRGRAAAGARGGRFLHATSLPQTQAVSEVDTDVNALDAAYVISLLCNIICIVHVRVNNQFRR